MANLMAEGESILSSDSSSGPEEDEASEVSVPACETHQPPCQVPEEEGLSVDTANAEPVSQVETTEGTVPAPGDDAVLPPGGKRRKKRRKFAPTTDAEASHVHAEDASEAAAQTAADGEGSAVEEAVTVPKSPHVKRKKHRRKFAKNAGEE